jgi:hypothetical protein
MIALRIENESPKANLLILAQTLLINSFAMKAFKTHTGDELAVGDPGLPLPLRLVVALRDGDHV